MIFAISIMIKINVTNKDKIAYPMVLKSSEPVENNALIAVVIERTKLMI